MSDDAKVNLHEWSKTGAIIIAQLVGIVAFAFILKGDVDYLKRDVGELRVDVKHLSRSAEKFEGETKSISLISDRIAHTAERVSRLEDLFLPGKARDSRNK